MNLALLPQSERDLMQADLLACQIRRESKGMALRDRRRHAKEKLDRMPEAKREMVVAALRKRAGK